MNFLIYKHTSPTGKSYIGLTSKSMNERLYEHVKASKCDSNTRFHQAIRKYGIEKFKKDDLQ